MRSLRRAEYIANAMELGLSRTEASARWEVIAGLVARTVAGEITETQALDFLDLFPAQRAVKFVATA